MLEEKKSHILPGLKPVLEALETIPKRIDLVLLRKGLDSRETRQILDLCQQHGIKVSRVDSSVLDQYCRRSHSSQQITHQGVVARLSQTEFVDLETLTAKLTSVPLPLILALDQIQDPGNLGTLIRTLYALGGLGLLVPLHNTAALGVAAERSAAGALEKLPICRVVNLGHALDDLETLGFTLYGATQNSPQSLNAFRADWQFPCVLVLGSEAKGIRPFVAKRCQYKLSIPQARPFDSLNVAQAGAILLGFAAANYQKLKTL
ncbi:MAG: RNA methyltransferase [Desulfovibrionaceae bacterium]|nr:RNA methyltransferase [Desulfovibrionaceae bacterium]